ncbi:MAG: hypothetical protein DHS20C15_19970 [Planctomycetota bacterium]|nr:MAG: hypothetical protein DHS20C15_19970 [Planctomycetota bacterium]
MTSGKSVALLVVGLVLIIWGVSAADSISSGFSELFTGSPSAKAVWLLLGGLFAGILGLTGVLRAQAS